jgi:hypothetical protein
LKSFSIPSRELKQRLKEASKKQRGEDVEAFATRLLINQELLKDAGMSLLDEDLIDDFIAGLKSEPGPLGDVFWHMFNFFNGTFDEALSKAKEAERDFKSRNSLTDDRASYSAIGQQASNPSPIKKLVDQVQVVLDCQQELLTRVRGENKAVNNIASTVSKESATTSSKPSSPVSNRRGNSSSEQAQGKRSIVCHYCGIQGHIRTVCKKRAQDYKDKCVGRQACQAWKDSREKYEREKTQAAATKPAESKQTVIPNPVQMIQPTMPMPMPVPYYNFWPPQYPQQFQMNTAAQPSNCSGGSSLQSSMQQQ